ncbi:MAG: ABC transporter substrate-binding protein [Caldilineaceae bacterium]
MYNRRNFLKLSAGTLTSALFALQGCGADPAAAPSAATATSVLQPTPDSLPFRIAIPGTPKHFDPALYSVIEEFQMGFAIFDGLVWVDHTLTPQPLLAETWESSNALDRWTFKLREDVLFHHGTPLTAEDVVYTFNRILIHAAILHFAIRSVLWKQWRQLTSIRYDFSSGAQVPNCLCSWAPQARIVAQDYASETLDIQPSGTGLFALSSMYQGIG